MTMMKLLMSWSNRLRTIVLLQSIRCLYDACGVRHGVAQNFDDSPGRRRRRWRWRNPIWQVSYWFSIPSKWWHSGNESLRTVSIQDSSFCDTCSADNRRKQNSGDCRAAHFQPSSPDTPPPLHSRYIASLLWCHDCQNPPINIANGRIERGRSDT